MQYDVLITEAAERDIEEIYNYIAEFDSPSNADDVLDQLMGVVDGLANFPERGAYPKELLALGIREYRQAFFKPYRVIYRAMENQVAIYSPITPIWADFSRCTRFWVDCRYDAGGFPFVWASAAGLGQDALAHARPCPEA